MSGTVHHSRPVFGIIPARYDSTRFPGKALCSINGKPMFWHVWSRAMLCPAFSSVSLATDDERIEKAANELGVPVLLTSREHQSGTDRVHEASQKLHLPENAVVVNLQGDEPLLDPDSVSALLDLFVDPVVEAATLAYPLRIVDVERADKVKVVLDSQNYALYFSRAAIPFSRDGEYSAKPLGHIGLYAFTMTTLKKFVSLSPSSLEITEKLEQLRLLENGIRIKVAVVAESAPGVDSPEDLETILQMLR